MFSDEEVSNIERFAKGTSQSPETPELRRLIEMDWDFTDAKTSYLTHGLHPYPAKFIPQIPNALIQELSGVGDTVADIFCGSGTTLVESLVLKRHTIGVDANPLACLISRAKTSLLAQVQLERLSHLVALAGEFANEIGGAPRPLFPTYSFVSKAWRPKSDVLSFWFQPFVVEELAEILSWCQSLPVDSQAVALAAFSSIVVTVSKQDSDTRYVRREKQIAPGDVFKRFGKALFDAVHCVTELSELVEPRFQSTIVNANVLDEPEVGQVDLVVCSPPYPNAYSYHLYHMTRMLWLGMDQPTFKRIEIGSHRKYSAKSADIETFRQEMLIVFSWIHRVLRKGAYACFVVGDSIVRGNRHDNSEIISAAARQHGFTEVARIARRLNDTKKAFNPAIGKIRTENVIVLQN